MRRSLIKAYAARLGRERGTSVSPGEAEGLILDSVTRVAINVARNFRGGFGYFSQEDLEHEGVVLALEVLEADKYDASRPLENFLYVHVKNQLHNLKRKVFMRAEPPCRCCEAFGSPVAPCKKWLDWNARNESKQNLMRPLDVSSSSYEGERNMAVDSAAGEAGGREILQLIDEGLSAEIRADYLRMRAGVSIPKGRRQRVREAVLEIVGAEALGLVG